MKKIHRLVPYIIVAAAMAACAKASVESANEANKRYLDAWISINYPELTPQWKGQQDPDGLYIIPSETQEGTGAEVTNNGYAIVSYTTTDLEGNYTAYTDTETAMQMGAYDSTYYYGPQVWLTMDGTIPAGVQDAIVGMKVGGSKKIIVPSWLMTYSTYATAKEYLNTSSSYSNTIYDFQVEDFTEDINEWQIEKIKKHINDAYGGIESFNQNVRVDSTGFYFKSLEQQNAEPVAFKSDTTIYINYTGRLLNGLMFDTNVERTAKDNGLYSETRTYEPVKIQWGDAYTDITMEGSSVVNGFAMALWNLNDLGDSGKMDKGIGIFYSPLGYGTSGSGSSIPAYAPLVFEIEIVPAPEE